MRDGAYLILAYKEKFTNVRGGLLLPLRSVMIEEGTSCSTTRNVTTIYIEVSNGVTTA